MRVLEARFHPDQNATRDFVVVGHVVWNEDAPTSQPQIRPARSTLSSRAPDAMLAKLQYLVEITAPQSFQALQGLKSQFWSFVDVSSPAGA
jgi:hypothetical protein